MSKIKDAIESIKDDLEFFDDELDKYQFIIDLGKKLKPFNDTDQKDEYLVQGCTSQVWLVPTIKDGTLYLSGTSDAIIVKGLVHIILEVFNERTIEEIQEFDINILSELGLAEIITPNRQSGVQGMIKKIMEVSKNG